jgi:hypothetical protein
VKKFLLFTLSIFLLFSLVSCAVKGTDGKTPYIQDGFWYIDGVNTGVKAAGVDGSNGKDGIDGKDGIGIEKIEIDSDGNFVVTFTNGTTQIVVPQNQKEENSTQEKQETQKTYDEIILILESTFANAKGQNYWNIKTTVGENTVSEYNKNNSPSRKRFHTPTSTNTKSKLQQYPFLPIEATLITSNYDTKKILSKDFNIFELKNLIGHHNVLPLMGKTILESFGINDTMINTAKLDSFLISLSNSYYITTL